MFGKFAVHVISYSYLFKFHEQPVKHHLISGGFQCFYFKPMKSRSCLPQNASCLYKHNYYVRQVLTNASYTAFCTYVLLGMLSKSMGQIIRVSAAMHVLFHLDNTDPLSDIITNSAIKAAIDFVEVCCQHTAYITGHGKIDEELEIMKSDNETTGE